MASELKVANVNSYNIIAEAIYLSSSALICALLLHLFYIKSIPKIEDFNSIIGAEDLKLVESSRAPIAFTQTTKGFRHGRWSNDSQLFVATQAVGEFVTFQLPVYPPGFYEFFVYLTRAKDYGKIQSFVNGIKVGSELDLFSNDYEIHSSGRISLGKIWLTGTDLWTLKVTGTNSNSLKPHYQLGIDGILLLRTVANE